MDLAQVQNVHTVRVTNRGDCCGAYLTLFTITVDDKVCGSNLVVPPGEAADFVCSSGPLQGQVVKIQLFGKGRILMVSSSHCLQLLSLIVSCIPNSKNSHCTLPIASSPSSHPHCLVFSQLCEVEVYEYADPATPSPTEGDNICFFYMSTI